MLNYTEVNKEYSKVLAVDDGGRLYSIIGTLLSDAMCYDVQLITDVIVIGKALDVQDYNLDIKLTGYNVAYRNIMSTDYKIRKIKINGYTFEIEHSKYIPSSVNLRVTHTANITDEKSFVNTLVKIKIIAYALMNIDTIRVYINNKELITNNISEYKITDNSLLSRRFECSRDGLFNINNICSAIDNIPNIELNVDTNILEHIAEFRSRYYSLLKNNTWIGMSELLNEIYQYIGEKCIALGKVENKDGSIKYLPTTYKYERSKKFKLKIVSKKDKEYKKLRNTCSSMLTTFCKEYNLYEDETIIGKLITCRNIAVHQKLGKAYYNKEQVIENYLYMLNALLLIDMDSKMINSMLSDIKPAIK